MVSEKVISKAFNFEAFSTSWCVRFEVAVIVVSLMAFRKVLFDALSQSVEIKNIEKRIMICDQYIRNLQKEQMKAVEKKQDDFWEPYNEMLCTEIDETGLLLNALRRSCQISHWFSDKKKMQYCGSSLETQLVSFDSMEEQQQFSDYLDIPLVDFSDDNEVKAYERSLSRNLHQNN